MALKILYGVQATGEGHLTRARHMAPALAAADADVDFLVSGRERSKLRDLQALGDFQTRRGWTFDNKNGEVRRLRTMFNARSFGRLVYDITKLDVSNYDLVVTDFEPITAQKALRKGVPSIGIGHHHAFDYAIPKTGFNIVESGIMQIFAPARTEIGLHWHHFGQPILPPIVKRPVPDGPVQDNKVVVYLGFEDLGAVTRLVEGVSDHDFFIYHGDVKAKEDHGHLKYRPKSLEFFKDAATAGSILTGGGFETLAENFGKRLLVKPQANQPEQASNALALTALGLGHSMDTLDRDKVAAWLEQPPGPEIIYPDTAAALAQWIVAGDWRDFSPLIKPLWSQTRGLERLPKP